MRITKEQLEALKSKKGGFNKETLLALGVRWPPKKGWKKKLLKGGANSPITAEKKKKKAHRKLENRKNDVNSAAFLNGFEWRKLRYEALKKCGAKCQCCGGSAADGVVMHVDHIKPRKKYPELAKDINNLQVLCNLCNHGKGNWDETDWREPRLATLMGERVSE